MLVTDFDFYLPPELIAQRPLAERSASRMLHLMRETGTHSDRGFRDLPDLLRPSDMLVFNDTRVFPARLLGKRRGARAEPLSEQNPAMRSFLKGTVEALLTRQVGEFEWESLVRPGRKIDVGERLVFEGPQALLEAEVVQRGEFGERRLRFLPVPDFFARLEKVGHVPLPPYIDRADEADDRERYQTIFARETGSAAAPTAGLHFTPEVLQRFRERGIETADVTLHVGLGTFQPLRHDVVEENRLHREQYAISGDAAERINRAKREGKRVLAVGTTTVRTLEFAARENGEVRAGAGEAELFIYPGFKFKVVDGLLTNFHLPKSSLLMLVSAFAGREHTQRAYDHAVRERYRFFSYGDCMFIE